MGRNQAGSMKRKRASSASKGASLQKSTPSKKHKQDKVDACDTGTKGQDAAGLVTHRGGCHCGAVRFSVKASSHIDIVQCNCSVCTKKQNHHFIVPKSRFTLLKGKDALTTYTFNTHVAQHTFCKICGVQSFYSPRSNPDGFGIMPHCLDPGTVKSTKVVTYDGNQWEKAFASSNISQYSKETVKKKRK